MPNALSIMPPSPAQVMDLKPPAAPAAPAMREFGDAKLTRQFLYDDTLKAAQNIQPLSDDKYTLQLSDVDWMDPDRFSRKQRKEAILKGETLARRMKGTWNLIDNITGQPIERRQQVIARIPYLSSMGTFVHRGSEYTVNHQQRLKPGVFARVMDNGQIESHFNVPPGKGVSHRYFIDPAKGVFKMRLHQAEMPLMPLLQALGATDQEVRSAWGNDLFATNYAHNDAGVVKKLAQRLLRRDEQDGDEGTTRQRLVAAFNRMELDPEVTSRTLGQPFNRVTKEAILAATKKLLAVSKQEAEPDDRDNLAYQTFYGPEDLFRERLERDHGNLRKALFRKIAAAGTLAKMPSGALTPQVEQVLLGSGLAQAIEEINPAEVFDKQSRITRMGEGGIPSLDSIPDEARSVQTSHFGFIDPVRTPESFRAGIDLNMTHAARKGRDGRVYTQVRDRQGKLVWKAPQDLADSVFTTPDALTWDTKRVPVFKGGKFDYATRDQIDFVFPDFESASFSPLDNMVPFKSATKAGRAGMGSRYLTQALPLSGAEAPLVRSGRKPGGRYSSFEEEYGRHMGAVAADRPGRVLDVRDGVVRVKYDDGSTEDVELYQHHPFNRKTYLHQTATVQPGQTFKQGDLLARSNYTDDKGVTALGINARVAYLPYEGYNFEDATVISESMAKRMASEHMYQHDLEVTPKHRTGTKSYVSLFPTKFDRKTLDKLDEHGTIKAGETVEYGQPLILAAKEREYAHNKIHKKRQPGFTDESVVWEHHDPGVVTDVVRGKSGPVVLVKSVSPMQVGDKMSGRFGDKGVVAAIVPDSKMPHDKDGNPFEVLLSPDGTITRTNPIQNIEAALGKIAAKTGKPIAVPDFDQVADLNAWAQQQLTTHGLKDTEDVIWPEHGTKVGNIGTGNRFFMKLHHTAESKGQGRGSGAYSSDETPAKGGQTGSKRVALMDINALMSHGATENLRDVGLVRGQKGEDWWLQFMSGNKPAPPKVPQVYEKFVNQLKAAGINVVTSGHQSQVMALTNRDIDALAGNRVIKSGDTVNFDKNLKPVAGGLFDERLTGGHNGKQWAAIELPEPMPNPVMEEPIRRILGLTQKQYESVLGGDEPIVGHGTGPHAIASALGDLDVDRELTKVRAQYHSSRKTARDEAVRKWGYLSAAKKLGIHPRDWVLNRAPVLPPAFRPVSVLGDSGIPLVSDANYLYKELLEATRNYGDAKNELGPNHIGPERLAIYHAFKAVTGLADPVHPKLQEKGVRGVLKDVFGTSPKFGTVQRKLVSSTVDNVGRAVIVPNPDYDMDTIGVPENQAFEVYQKFIVRRLKRRGLPIREALRHVRDRSDLAKNILQEEMEDRPVYVNRAPVLHKFGIMAFKPKLVRGDVLQVSPLIVKGFNADFDGDAMQFHVPTTDEAVKEAYDRMLPSKSLLSPADFKSPMHVPGQQYQAGLYHATRQHKGGRPRVFRNRQDALAAYARREITAQTPIHIIEG